MEALDGIGIAGGGRVGLVSRVDLIFGCIGNGEGPLLLVLEAAVFAFVHPPGVVAKTKMVFFSI